MGKLAERYTDAARSGVYRVRDAAIPRAAALEAGALLTDLGMNDMLAGAWDAVVPRRDGPPQVLLVHDAGALAPSLLDELRAVAQASGAAGQPFFVVLVDPDEALRLPRLYKEHALVP